MSEPVLYVAGDIHYDGSDDTFVRWLDTLAGRTPAQLVILGDLVEYWVDGGSSAARYEPLLGRLRALRRAGWQVEVLRGNREMVAERALEIACGARLRWPRLDLRLGAVRIRIVHGDRLVHDPGYRTWAVFSRTFCFRALIQFSPAILRELVARMLRRTSRGNRPAQPRRYQLFIDPRRVRGAARGCDVLLAGHVHDSWRRRFGGIDLLLVGHWPPGQGHWVEGFADGRLERRHSTF